MKKILVLVLSADFSPYEKMIHTSKRTWDSIDVDGIETVYYCSNKNKQNTDNIIYFPIEDRLLNMGHKTLAAFEWALNNKEFDYIVRVNSSCYINKKKLAEYVNTLPNNDLFCGTEATSQNGFKYLWGGMQFIISKDVISNIVSNKSKWIHEYMEDESMSLVVSQLGYSFYAGRGCSINKTDEGWLLLSYPEGSKSVFFNTFDQIKASNEHFFRVKIDGNRNMDEYIMNELFKNLE